MHRVLLVACIAAALARAEVPDTRGPVTVNGMAVRIDREGVQAPGYHWTPIIGDPRWSATWVGTGASASATDLRKEFDLEEEPTRVRVWIASESYLLYVNGRPAARGAADTGRDFKGPPGDWRFYDARDLTGFFHKGRNVLAAELFQTNAWRFQANIDFADGRSVTVQSDTSWKSAPAGYLTTSDVPVDLQQRFSTGLKPSAVLFDAEREPIGWQLVGFNDASWQACVPVVPAVSRWLPNELPPLMEARYPAFDVVAVSGQVAVPDHALEPGHPVRVTGEGSFDVHFDKVMSGRPGIEVSGCTGAEVYLVVSENKDWKGRVYQLHLRDGLQYFESRDYASLGTIHVLVRHASSPVEIRQVSADFLSQPVEYLGSFECSDPALNTLWKSGRWSTQICLVTHHLDSPKHQEPISDYGDYVIEDLVNYVSMGTNPSIARQDLRKWAWIMDSEKYRTFHTSYQFAWLQALLNYYDYTGDKSVLVELAPQVRGVIAQFTTYLGANGLVSQAPNYMFMDWVTVHDDKQPSIGFAAHHPPAVVGQGYLTALFYRGLADAIRVCEVTGDRAQAQRDQALRAKIRDAYQRELWNEARGQYRDGKPFVTTIAPSTWLPADVAMESFSVQNNTLAVLEDLAPAARQEEIVETMNQNPHWEVTPYFMHYVFEAYAHAGRFDADAVQKMHAYQVSPGTQTVQEMGPGRGDFSHGWIASPTYQMTSKILGVSPVLPGFATFRVAPTYCGLSYANGVVPSPRGVIRLGWRRTEGKTTLEVTAPAGTCATIALPLDRTRPFTLTCDGHPIDPSWAGTRAQWDVGPGSHQVVASQTVQP